MASPSDPPGEARPTGARARPLRQAAAAVFAVTAIVPLLIFVWTLHRLDALSRGQAQVGLGLALAIALLGFQIFRVLMRRMSDQIQALGKAAEQPAPSARRPPPAAAPPLAAPPAASPPATLPQPPGVPLQPLVAPPPGGEARASVFARPPQDAAQPKPQAAAPAAPPSRAAPPTAPPVAGRALVLPAATTPPAVTGQWRSQAAAGLTVPGIGDIQEVHDLNRAMALLWMSEATMLKGHRVSVSILNSPRPVAGTLLDVTDEGLVLQPDGAAAPLTLPYGRVSAIDAEQTPGPG